MPVLRNYTAQLGGLPSIGARATPEDFGAGTAAALGGLAQTVAKAAGTYLSVKEADEDREVIVQSASVKAKYAKELDAAAISGADTEKIKQQMNDELAQIGSAFQTKRGQDSLNLATSNTNLMFDEQANRVEVQRAGDKAKLAGQRFLSTTSALVAADPTYLPKAEESADALANTLVLTSSDKKALIAEGLKQELNMTAVMSRARVDPAGTRAELEAGKYTLTPDQRQYALREAEFAERAIRADESYQRAQKNYEVDQADEKARDNVFKGIMGGTVRTQDILNNPDLKPATREHLIGVQRVRTEELANNPKPSNPVTKRELWLDINAPEGDKRKIYTTDKIYSAVQAGKLNTTDANQLLSMVANNKDENNRSFSQRLGMRMTNIGRAISSNPEFAAQPDLAASVQNEIAARAEKRASDLRKAGKSPDVMLDPADKDYFFTPGMIKQTANDVKEQMMPSMPDLRSQPDAWQDLPEGQPFIDPNGTPRTMTKELKNALKAQSGTE